MNSGRGAGLPSAHTVFFGFTPGRGIVYWISEKGKGEGGAPRERGPWKSEPGRGRRVHLSRNNLH